jgi:hypothetical protein
VGCGAQDSSGLRWLPNTPAPAIFVMLVITLRDGADGGVLLDVQLVTTVSETAAIMATLAARTPGLTTWPTVTSALPVTAYDSS